MNNEKMRIFNQDENFNQRKFHQKDINENNCKKRPSLKG